MLFHIPCPIDSCELLKKYQLLRKILIPDIYLLTFRTDLDYGSLLCYGENQIGRQDQPCTFQIVPTQPPEPVHACAPLNQDQDSVDVKCEPGMSSCGVLHTGRFRIFAPIGCSLMLAFADESSSNDHLTHCAIND